MSQLRKAHLLQDLHQVVPREIILDTGSKGSQALVLSLMANGAILPLFQRLQLLRFNVKMIVVLLANQALR